MNIARLSRIVQVVLWLATLLAAAVWIAMPKPPFDPEPVTVILGLVSTAISALLSEYAIALEKEKYSTSYALAFGYVNNFIDPVITRLTRNSVKPHLLIYMPQSLQELEPSNVQRVIAQIHEKQFSEKVITVEADAGRTRDLFSIFKEPGQAFYFDFPSTLLTLNSLIDYNLQQRNNRSSRAELGALYIDQFKKALNKMLEEKNLGQFVGFTNKDLEGFD